MKSAGSGEAQLPFSIERSSGEAQFQNPHLARLAKTVYRTHDLSRIEAELQSHGTVAFVQLPTGLFAASSAGESISTSGYGNVWVRDNVQVAYAHLVSGRTEVAAGVARALLQFFDRHRHRFEDIISGAADLQDVMMRPHVRFDGNHLSEIADQWPHAQNDALGYFLWLYAQLAEGGHVELDEKTVSVLSLFPRYFEAIRYWEDEDSGHWEEVRKVSASSIGTVVAGLEALHGLARKRLGAFTHRSFGMNLVETTANLSARGRFELNKILPNECIQFSPDQNRRYDAALLFLLYPLEIVGGAMADLLLHDVRTYLTGKLGIRRYLRDSYFAPDFDQRFPEERQTADLSAPDEMRVRDALIGDVGEEAQWCIFDPILSAYYGSRFLLTKSKADLEGQTYHFNRALAQITDLWQCPELYCIQTTEDELKRRRFRPNPHIPLQWTQANVVVAIGAMRATIGLSR